MASFPRNAPSTSVAHVPRAPVLGQGALSGTAAPLHKPGQGLGVLYTTSGSAAIEIALRIAGIKPGDRVLFPTYHCPTMIAPAVRLGAVPKFYPLTRTGAPRLPFLRDCDLAGASAMLVAHYFGFPQPLDEVRSWCSEKRIALIEDYAHAFFSLLSGADLVAARGFAVASLPKFFPVQEGGLVITARERLSDLRLQSRPVFDELRTLLDGLEISSRYHRIGALSAPMGVLFRLKNSLRNHTRAFVPQQTSATADAMSSVAADQRSAHMRPTRTTRWIAEHADRKRIVHLRRRNYALLAKLLHTMPDASPLWPELPEHVVPYVFPLLLKNAERCYQAMRAHAVPAFRWDVAWPDTPAIPGDAGQQWARDVVQVACHQDMSEDDVRLVAQTIQAIVAEVAP